jgi:inosine/xanthosine triphosphatase
VKRVAIASRNPVKTQATLQGFQKIFPDEEFEIVEVSVPSGVAGQPTSRAETLQGALNRVNEAVKLLEDVDYWVGIEGGVEEMDGNMAVFAWVVVRSGDVVSKSQTGIFFLPPRVADLIRQGLEMGEADDIVFETTNSGQEEGAIGILTREAITRTGYYSHAVMLALVPFKNRDLYPG